MGLPLAANVGSTPIISTIIVLLDYENAILYNMAMKPLIVETDIGHDPDDYFALCYLHSAGYDIKSVLVTIGHPYQVAIVKMFCKQVGLDIPIGVARIETQEAKEDIGFHNSVLKKYGFPTSAKADGLGKDLIGDILKANKDCEIFVCGPPKNLGAYVKANPNVNLPKITFQGGFLGYSLHDFKVQQLPKFVGKLTAPTFNLNGAKNEVLDIVGNPNVESMQFVSKNVCHTVIYDKARHAFMKEVPPKNRADELFMEGMDIYLSKHSEKKFHDPTAACVMKHPEIANWVKGKIYNARGEWGTMPDESANSRTIAAIDYDLLWDLIRSRE